MAKKTAVKKKPVQVKSKPKLQAKSAKPVKKTETKQMKSVKASAPAVKTKTVEKLSAAKKSDESSKPALMTAKGKEAKAKSEPKSASPKLTVESLEATSKKTQTVVTLIEKASQELEEPQKVEKVSKIKPVKVERGNLNDEKSKWLELNKRYGKEKPFNYKMTEKYPALVPLQHKVLGWGFVLTNENDRLEVLFENGIRILISNYKN
jgi:hypothetical protein